jgi:hypothetical protein
MTVSSIIYSTINENYPAAGQDNDSQGFRDNFARIKTALSTAQTEITYLNSNAADKTKNNDFGKNVQSNLILKNHGIRSDTAVNAAATTSVISFGDFQYKKYVISNTTNVFQVDNFPVGCYSEIFLEIISSTGTKRVSFQKGVLDSTLTSSTQYLHLGSGFGNNAYVDCARTDNSNNIQRYLFKVASPDGGINTFVSVVDIFKQQP